MVFKKITNAAKKVFEDAIKKSKQLKPAEGNIAKYEQQSLFRVSEEASIAKEETKKQKSIDFFKNTTLHDNALKYRKNAAINEIKDNIKKINEARKKKGLKEVAFSDEYIQKHVEKKIDKNVLQPTAMDYILGNNMHHYATGIAVSGYALHSLFATRHGRPNSSLYRQ